MTLSKNFELTSKTERDTPEFECQKLQVYAGSMVSTYRYASDKLSSDYATPDKRHRKSVDLLERTAIMEASHIRPYTVIRKKPMIISNMCMHRIIVMQR